MGSLLNVLLRYFKDQGCAQYSIFYTPVVNITIKLYKSLWEFALVYQNIREESKGGAKIEGLQKEGIDGMMYSLRKDKNYIASTHG